EEEDELPAEEAAGRTGSAGRPGGSPSYLQQNVVVGHQVQSTDFGSVAVQAQNPHLRGQALIAKSECCCVLKNFGCIELREEAADGKDGPSSKTDCITIVNGSMAVDQLCSSCCHVGYLTADISFCLCREAELWPCESVWHVNAGKQQNLCVRCVSEASSSYGHSQSERTGGACRGSSYFSIPSLSFGGTTSFLWEFCF
ncbi:unnamed protein product, partial [Symbiodinium sp. CCMP2456]